MSLFTHSRHSKIYIIFFRTLNTKMILGGMSDQFFPKEKKVKGKYAVNILNKQKNYNLNIYIFKALSVKQVFFFIQPKRIAIYTQPSY